MSLPMMHRPVSHKYSGLSPSGFTLVELLVVLAILAILVALAWSGASGAIEKARATACLGSLRQVGMAVQLYAADHDNRLPNTSHQRAGDGSSLSWTLTLADYLGKDFIGKCPCNRTSPAAVTYGWNDCLTENGGEGIPLARCRTPSSTLMVGETADGYTSEHFHFSAARSRITFNQFKSSVSVDRHGKKAHYLFVDGHAESLASADVRNRLNAPNTTFIKP